jgi:hypothetical protein
VSGVSPMTVVAYAPDLMDRSRISAAVPGVRFVDGPADLVGTDAEVVLVDLGRAGVLDVLPRIEARTVGFASHVDGETIAAAEAAGCDEVLPRSRFFRRLPDLTRR